MPKNTYADTLPDILHFEQFATPEGLPNNIVQQIYQDKDGFIWIATAYGLFRYDGYDINTLKSNLYTPGKLINNNVICVAEDNAHRLWIGTHEGVCIMDKRTGRIKSLKLKGISKQRVNDILVTGTGRVYLGYIRGLAYYDEKGDSLISVSRHNSQGKILEGQNIQTLLEDENGDILIGTWEQGLLRLRPTDNEIVTYTGIEGLKSILCLFRDSRGMLWIGTNGSGLFKTRFTTDLHGISIKNFKHSHEIQTSLPSDYVYAVHEDLQTASIWVGTRDGIGIMPSDKEGTFVNYSEHSAEHQLPAREISTILRDESGLMWLGSEGNGIFHVNTHPKAFQTIGPKGQVSAVWMDGKGGLWAGRDRGIDYISGQMKQSFFPTRRPRDITYSNQTSEVLLAIQDEGIIVCKEGKILRQYKKNNCGFIPDNLVFTVCEDRKGNWWIGSYKGLSVHYHDGRNFIFNHSEGKQELLSGEITAIAVEGDTSLWLVSDADKIVHVTGNLDTPDNLHKKAYRMTTGTPLCFFIDRSGRIWVGTEGSGLCLYNAHTDQFESVHRLYNLPGDMVGSIEEDSYGNLWLGTNSGLARLSITGEKKGKVRTFTVADGLPDNFFNPHASCSKEGMLYFGCSRGIVAFNPKMADGQTTDKTPRITDIYIDGLSIEQYTDSERKGISSYTPDFIQKLQIPSKYSSFSLKFAMLTYNRPQQNRYAYRLVGFDKEWHYTQTDARTAYYTQVPPGTYTFELRATNENGDWSKLRTLEIVVEPSFWSTGWAYFLYIIGILVISGFILDALRRLSRLIPLPYLYKWILRCLKKEGHKSRKALAIEIKQPDYTDIDEAFLQKAVACVNSHLNDPAFDIPQFVEEMATSRTTLHKRLKALTGLNASGFIRSIRLKAAYKLISENKNIRISDLAYHVGFNDPKYFSLCFKKEFGVQPSEIKNKDSEVESCSEKEIKT